MRDIINKGLTNEELLRGVKTAWDRGWKQVTFFTFLLPYGHLFPVIVRQDDFVASLPQKLHKPGYASALLSLHILII